MGRSEPPHVLSGDALLSHGVRALLRARRASAAAPSRLLAASAAEGESKTMGYAKDVVAGTAGGIAVVLVGHPFDTLKVLLQTQPSDKPIYNGVVDAAKARARAVGRAAARAGARRLGVARAAILVAPPLPPAAPHGARELTRACRRRKRWRPRAWAACTKASQRR